MPRDRCEWCRRRLLVEAFTKYEFQRGDRPAFYKECTADMKLVDEKWCTTCRGWATKAEDEVTTRRADDRGGDAAGDEGGGKELGPCIAQGAAMSKPSRSRAVTVQSGTTASAQYGVRTMRACRCSRSRQRCRKRRKSAKQQGTDSAGSAQWSGGKRCCEQITRQQTANEKPRRTRSR